MKECGSRCPRERGSQGQVDPWERQVAQRGRQPVDVSLLAGGGAHS